MAKGIKKVTKRRILAVMLATAMTAGSVSENGGLFPLSVEAATKTAADLQNPTVKSGMTTWDCIWFGSYYQSDISGKLKDPIKWRVLSIDGNDAFLLADKALEQMPYCQGTVVDPEPDKWGNIKTELKTDTLYWENCTLRSFLNGYDGSQNVTELDYTEDNFLDTAFTKEEQEGILTTTVTADANPDKNSPQGKDTEDKIYLLSVKEAMDKKYGFASDEARRYYNTPNYTFVGGRSGEKAKIGVGQEIGYAWWTRTSGQEYSGRYVYPVGTGLYGGIETQGGYGESPGFGVRPALHVDLSKVEGLWEYAGTVNSDGTMAEENAKEPAVPTEPTATPEITGEPEKTVEPTKTPEVTEKPKKTVEPTRTPEVTDKPTKTDVPISTNAPTEPPSPKNYVITFHSQSGTIFTGNDQYEMNVLANGIINVDTVTVERKDYAFKGWYTEPIGGKKVTELKVTENITLYAQWTKVTVKKGTVSKLQNQKGRKVIVTIKKISGTQGYEVVYADNSKLKNAKKKKGTKLTVTLSGLKKGKTYYVKVRAYKEDSTGKKIYGTYSSAKKVKIVK